MPTITITVSEELAEKAEAHGLQLPALFEEYMRVKFEETREEVDGEDGDDDFDPVKKGFVSPRIYGKGIILRDIISPVVREIETTEDQKAKPCAETFDGDENEDDDFDPVKKGFVSPKIYGKGIILGDVISPMFEEIGDGN